VTFQDPDQLLRVARQRLLLRTGRQLLRPVPHRGHLQLEDHLGRVPAALVVGRPQLHPQGGDRLVHGFLGDLAAGGTQQPAVLQAGRLRESAELVGVGFEIGGDGFPGEPAGAEVGDFFEERIGSGV
jgi:hypothetical protein